MSETSGEPALAPFRASTPSWANRGHTSPKRPTPTSTMRSPQPDSAFDEGPWRSMPGAERGRLMRRLADEIEESADELALAETRDNGKLLREMGGQLRNLPNWYRYFAGFADKIDGRVVDAGRSDFLAYVSREPVGVVAAIVPVELPAPASDVQAGAGAGGGVHRGRQTVGARFCLSTEACPPL